MINCEDIIFFLLFSSEQQRQNDRELRKAGRDLERDKAALEREEKKLVSWQGTLVYLKYHLKSFILYLNGGNMLLLLQFNLYVISQFIKK